MLGVLAGFSLGMIPCSVCARPAVEQRAMATAASARGRRSFGVTWRASGSRRIGGGETPASERNLRGTVYQAKGTNCRFYDTRGAPSPADGQLSTRPHPRTV